jgi:signal transduction histidine kinase
VRTCLRTWLAALCIFFGLPGIGTLDAIEEPYVELKSDSHLLLENMPWEFYWQKYIFPGKFSEADGGPDLVLVKPMIWNGLQITGKTLGSFGYATYRVRFFVPVSRERLGLRIAAPLSSYRVFINGQKMAEEGSLSESAEGFVAKRKSALLFFNAPEGKVEIVIHVANFLMYKGGLRTDTELGDASVMQSFGMRYLSVDLFCIGLIFSIMLYHFFLYFLSKRDLPILIFAFVSLDYFLLAALFGEQWITLFFPSFPVSIHARLSSIFTYLLPALVVYFTSALYPGIIPLTILRVFWGIAGLFIALLVLPVHLFTAYNVVYYAVAGVGSAMVCLWATSRAMRQGRAGAHFLGAGIFILLAVTVYSVFLFATNALAGSFLSIGFSLFALAQSGSLARAHAVLTHENDAMQLRLERSRVALAHQRKQIEANLHDSLGGNLTDIKLGLEAISKEPGARTVRNDILRLDKRVAGTIASLRTELLFLEDMQLAVEDFVAGINLILLRRYQMAKRPVDINITPETRALGPRLKATGVLTAESIPELCMIIQELCNNSLKYSVGQARWEIVATTESLQIAVSGRSRYRRGQPGLGRNTLRQRMERIGAKFVEESTAGSYSAHVLLS